MNPLALIGLAVALNTPTPSLELAELQIRQAQLRTALRTLESLTTHGSLDRAGLVRTLVLRLQLYAALKQPRALAQDAYDLASLAPDTSVVGLRPDAKAAFLRAKSATPPAPALTMTAAYRDGRVVVRASPSGPASLVKDVRLYARVTGDRWHISPGAPIVLNARPDASIEFYGAIIGPGGAVIAQAGSAAHPRRWSRPTVLSNAIPVPPPTAEPTPVWPWIVGGTVIVVTAAIVTGVVLSNNADTRLVVRPN